VNRRQKVRIIRKKYKGLRSVFNERSLRLWAATEAGALGRGGIAIVSEAVDIDRNTIIAGMRELEHPPGIPPDRIRRRGGGRKTLLHNDKTLKVDLEKIVDPHVRGDPESPLKWVSKSTGNIADELERQGHTISQQTVRRLLRADEYSMQSNRKRREGKEHPDRDLQFRFISEGVQKQLKKNQPCISIDTKKKENIGNYKNNGSAWSKRGKPVEVNMHDFPDKKKGKAVPYGVYDLLANNGWVNVGIDHDTAQFAVESIRRWWRFMGKQRYPTATELLITADSGGSNSARSKLWKVELQKLANKTRLTIHVRHFPPGTSKWNKIEHRLFSMISKNWSGRPLTSFATVVNLIAATKTKTGMIVRAMLDEGLYEKGIVVPKHVLAAVNLTRDTFHGDWNYTIAPQ